MLKWGLALCSTVLLRLGWGAADIFYYGLFFSFIPLLIAEHFYTKRLETKYAIGLFSIALFQLLAGFKLIDNETGAVVTLLLVNALVCSVPWALYIIVKRHCALPLAMATLVLCWLAIEQLAAETGIPSPWFQLGNGLSGRPAFLQFVEYTGVNGGSLWILGSNTACFLCLSYMPQLPELGHRIGVVLIPILIVVIPIIVSRSIAFEVSAAPEEVLILHTQQTDRQLMKPTFFELLEMSKGNVTTHTKYLIWPESIFEFSLPYKRAGSSPLIAGARKLLTKNTNMEFLLGLLLETEDKVYNTAVTLTLDSTYIYEKRRIAPFSEYQPSISGSLDFLGWSDPDIAPGRDTFHQSGKVSPSICYETLFGHLVAENTVKSKGQVIALISNESWTTGASEFLLKIAALRAIENRKYVLRSTHNGISAVITPAGLIINKSTGQESIEILKSDIVCNSYQTFYMSSGDLIGRGAVATTPALLLLIVMQGILKKRRIPKKSDRPT